MLAYLVEHGVKLGIRVRGRAKGELEWRRPNRMTLQNLLRHPIYAGSLRLWPSPGGSPQEEARPPFHRAHGGARRWHVLIKGRLPAYISWERYERNLGHLAENRARSDAMGASREGPSLLQGLLVCGKCSARVTVRYGGSRKA